MYSQRVVVIVLREVLRTYQVVCVCVCKEILCVKKYSDRLKVSKQKKERKRNVLTQVLKV